MKAIYSLACSTLAVMFLGGLAGCGMPIRSVGGIPNLELEFTEPAQQWSGTWKIPGKPGSLFDGIQEAGIQVIERTGSSKRFIGHLSAREAGLLDADRNGANAFGLESDAGHFRLTVTPSPDVYHGTFELEANGSYNDLVETITGAPLEARELLLALFNKVSYADLEAYQATDFDLAEGRLWDLVRHRITAKTAVAYRAGLPSVTTEGLIELRRYGVNPDYIPPITALHPDFDVSDLVELRRYGVQPDYVQSIAPHFPDFDAKSYVNLRRYGVPASFVGEVAPLFPAFSAEDFTALRRAGVNSNYAKAFHTTDHHFDAEGIALLRRHGVPESWGREIAKYPKYQNAKLLADLRRNGVPIDLVAATYDLALVRHSDDLITLRRNGVPAKTVRQLASADPELTVDDIVALRRYGVTAEYFTTIRSSAPYSAEEITNFRRYGVPEDYVKEANSGRDKPLDAQALIDLRRRGVSVDTIRQLSQ